MFQVGQQSTVTRDELPADPWAVAFLRAGIGGVEPVDEVGPGAELEVGPAVLGRVSGSGDHGNVHEGNPLMNASRSLARTMRRPPSLTEVRRWSASIAHSVDLLTLSRALTSSTVRRWSRLDVMGAPYIILDDTGAATVLTPCQG